MDFLFLFKKYWHYSRPEQWRVVWYLLWHTVSVLGLLFQPYAFAMVLNSLQTERFTDAGKWLAGHVAGFVINEFFMRLARATERYLAFRNRKRFILSVYDKLQELPLSWHNNHHSANVIDRINKAADALFSFGQNQDKYIEVGVSFIGAIIFLWVLSPVAVIVGLFTGLTSVFATKWFYKRTIPEYRAQNELFHTLAAAFMDYISNITTIIVLRLGKRARFDLENRTDEIFPHIKREHRYTQAKCFVNALFVAALHVGMIFYYIYSRSSAGTIIMLGSVTALFQYLGIFMRTFDFYSGDYENVIHWWQDYNAAAIIFNSGEPLAVFSTGTKQLPGDWKTITVNPFAFSYGDGQARINCHSIRLERGKRIAFVGESGAGKSTCLNVLRGLLPTDGSIITDGKTAYPICVLGDAAILVSQEPEIFENTIRYNITVGLPSNDNEMEAAAYMACFNEVVSNLQRGYDADIRENGVNLSGGEKQRLALARGIFAMANNSLILLDEPTGSLDVITEERIYKRIFNGFQDACIISTLHRLHLLPMFDYIYVFHDGGIIENGTFNELLDMEGILFKLWEKYQRVGDIK